MPPAARFPIALLAVAALAGLGYAAVEQGRAGSIVYDAAREMSAWSASGRPPAPGTVAWVRENVERAARITPDDPTTEEMRGELALRERDRAGAADEALAHFTRAVALRPTSPYAWAGAVSALYLKGGRGPMFEAALRRASELGPAEREVQLAVADYGLSVWDEVQPATRTAVEAMITGAMKRDPAEILQLAQRRGRLAVACRHIHDAPRRVGRQWFPLCAGRETLS